MAGRVHQKLEDILVDQNELEAIGVERVVLSGGEPLLHPKIDHIVHISQSRIPNGTIGIYELEVSEGTQVTQATLAELPLSGRCLIAAVERDGFVRVPTANDTLQPGDVAVALIDQPAAKESLALFNS